MNEIYPNIIFKHVKGMSIPMHVKDELSLFNASLFLIKEHYVLNDEESIECIENKDGKLAYKILCERNLVLFNKMNDTNISFAEVEDQMRKMEQV